MSETENKRRLMSIGWKVKEARERMGLTQEQFADKYGYARPTLAKLEAGIRDFKSTEIIKLAEQLNVSCDYLLGLTRAAPLDDFIQAESSRYGLSDEALKTLERLGKTPKSAREASENADAPLVLFTLERLLTDARGREALTHMAKYLNAGEFRFSDGSKSVTVKTGNLVMPAPRPMNINVNTSVLITPDMISAILFEQIKELLRDMKSHLPTEEIEAARTEFNNDNKK
jgi:transcriptional regulator with XRE-family HTH domain